MQIKILKKHFWKGQRLLLLAFLLVHTAASYYYISHQNITFDEPHYIEYAKRWLHGRPERVEPLDDSKSPVIAICWLPRVLRQIIRPDYHLNDYGRKDQEEGRYMMIIFSLITALYVYWWCKELYGIKGWVMPLLLLLFDPLYLSYSAIITTDLACGTFLVALLYHYRKFLVYKERKHFYLAALFTGIAIVTKQTMLFTVLLLPLLSMVFFEVQHQRKNLFTKRTFIDAALFAIIIIATINCLYYFHKSFIPLGQYVFESTCFQNLQKSFSLLHSIPVPLPEAYVQSVDMIKAHAEYGPGKSLSTYNGVYLFGELNLNGGFWYYYLVLLFYKMPIGTLLLSAASIFVFFKKFRRQSFIQQYLFLLLPILFFGILLSFFNQFQMGVRHILLVFPLLYIGLGKLFRQLPAAEFKYQVLAACAVAYTFISVSVYYPYIIPYTNEFITNKKTVYRKIMDSSIDYGQADSSITAFIAEHPSYRRASSIPDTGKFVVVMNRLLNSYLRDRNQYNWYQKLEPQGIYRYVVLLYDIKDEDLVNAGIRK